MPTDDIKLKRFLVLQSFAPLFILLVIKHFVDPILVFYFFQRLFHNPVGALVQAIHHAEFGNMLISAMCIGWMLLTLLVSRGFKDLQSYGLVAHGESVILVEQKQDSSLTFLMTFILPLLVDSVDTIRGFVFFVALLLMVVVLLMKSNLFYQNPVLAVLGYKVYAFKVLDPAADMDGEKVYIGITKGNGVTDKAVIKRKHIADDVYLIYNA